MLFLHLGHAMLVAVYMTTPTASASIPATSFSGSIEHEIPQNQALDDLAFSLVDDIKISSRKPGARSPNMKRNMQFTTPRLEARSVVPTHYNVPNSQTRLTVWPGGGAIQLLPLVHGISVAFNTIRDELAANSAATLLSPSAFPLSIGTPQVEVVMRMVAAHGPHLTLGVIYEALRGLWLLSIEQKMRFELVFEIFDGNWGLVGSGSIKAVQHWNV